MNLWRLHIWDCGNCFSMYNIDIHSMVTHELVIHVQHIIFTNEFFISATIKQELNVSRETIWEVY